jgi:16S rRNA (cytosine967-C5)-methyltransferase
MENRGRLLAYDSDAERLDRLMQRCARAGLSNVHVLRAPPAGLVLDTVLVDAPCSELGSLRRGPDLRFLKAPSVLTEFVPLQRELLARAGESVRPGGRLVYATCTVNRAENQELVAGFLRQRPDFRLVPPGAGWLRPECIQEGFLVCSPHRHGTDAFFAAVLERSGAGKAGKGGGF